MNDLLFAAVDLPVLDKVSATQSILDIDDSHSWWDEYRSTKMYPLMVKQGKTADNSKPGEFLWHPCAPQIIVDWFETVVFPWIGSKSRVIGLVTQPHFSNTEHIDCEPHEVGTLQHKFRIVLQGETDTLYFKTDRGQVSAPRTDGCFIMDGGWPHGMTNYSDRVKVTIALGSPWNGRDHYDNVTVLQRRSDYMMPSDLGPYFRK
jgi:hypothetical protein